MNGPLSRLRGNAAGLVDQVVSAGSNAATGLLVLLFLPPSKADAVLFAIGVGYFAIGIARALVGDVLLTYSARYGVAEQARHAADATKTAGALGLLTAAVTLAVWERDRKVRYPNRGGSVTKNAAPKDAAAARAATAAALSVAAAPAGSGAAPQANNGGASSSGA